VRMQLRGAVHATCDRSHVKILDVTEFYSERGGGVRSHLSLKGHVLCQLGHHHVVVAPGARDEVEEAAPLARGLGSARVIRVAGPASPYDPTYHLLSRFDKIVKIVERERPDVLEIHSPYLAALGALRAKRRDYGVRTFQWHSDFIDTYLGVLRSRVPVARSMLGDVVTSRVGAAAWTLVRGIAARCDATLVAAKWQAAKLEDHGVTRVRRVPFGIEHDVFRPDARSDAGRRDLLARVGAAAGPKARVLVGVGRFAIEKRWDVVVDAFAAVASALP
jgi:alpha-1,6-mannosyltransferase